MTKEEFKRRWESDEDGVGINFDDIAECARDWGIDPSPRTSKIGVVLYQVLEAADVDDLDEYAPYK